MTPFAVRGFAALALLGGCDGGLVPVEPARTVRVTTGPAALVGSEGTGCSNGQTAGGTTPERWCAFYRPTADGMATELWTVNLDRARARGTPLPCDGSSPDCRLLTATLWTGEPVFSPSHPYLHGFEGDTLVFYADSSTTGRDEAFLGPVRGWRPASAAPRVLSGNRGLVCVGQLRSDSVLCVENQATTGAGLEFDLLAGSMSHAPAGGPLPLIERIRPYDARGTLMWQVAFTPGGEHLAFSTRAPAPDMAVERLRIVETANIGAAAPTEVVRDIAHWQFSPDGKRVFFLRGYQYLADRDATGTLAVADFPGFTNLQNLAQGVGRFQVHADPQGGLSISLFQELADTLGNFRFMPDVSKPDQLVTVASQIEDARVSPDRRFTFFYDFDAQFDTVSVLARNDGSGRCTLNAKTGHVAFGVSFARAGNAVFWGEDSMADPAHNEGWYADPSACEPKTLFTSRVAYLQATNTGAVFGEEEATPLTMRLRHAAVRASDRTLDISDIASGASTTVALVDERFVVFTVNAEDPNAQGVYLHGPLP